MISIEFIFEIYNNSEFTPTFGKTFFLSVNLEKIANRLESYIGKNSSDKRYTNSNVGIFFFRDISIFPFTPFSLHMVLLCVLTQFSIDIFYLS